MLLFELILLTFALFSIPEQQPGHGARYLNVRTADQCAMIKWKASNKRKAGDAHVVCIRAAIVSFFSLLFELLTINSSIILIISKNEIVIWVDIY